MAKESREVRIAKPHGLRQLAQRLSAHSLVDELVEAAGDGAGISSPRVASVLLHVRALSS